jgi:hypothetical protein
VQFLPLPPKEGSGEKKAKMQSEAAQKIYHQRSQIAEFPHAGLKSDVGSDNFAAEGNKKQAWKLHGLALATTSSGYLAYAARSLTGLSLPPKGKAPMICFSLH